MTDALERLIEAVEADNSPPDTISSLAFDCGTQLRIYQRLVGFAYRGSLDAAKELHNALLPRWTACVGQNAHHGDWNAFVRLAQDGSITSEHWGGTDGKPARAWLLAILRAKLAENHPRQETSV